MALDFGQNRDFFLLDGKVLTTGGSLNVTDGVFAIVDNSKDGITQNGRKIVSNFSNLAKDKDFQMILGKINSPVTRSTSNKPYESLPFKLSEIESLTVTVPNEKGIKVDDFIIGYNGKPGTEITIADRTSTSIDIELSGDSMAALGYADAKVVVSLYLEHGYVDENDYCAECQDGVFTMQEVIEKAVERFNNMTLIGGAPITDYVEALVVNNLTALVAGAISYTYYNLTVQDDGTLSALARIQAQYPTYKVIKSNELGDPTSVYTILAPTGTSLTAYSVTLPQILKGCEDCPSGYTDVVGGVVYSITIDDAGADATTVIDNVPGFVTGTVVKISEEGNIGTYLVVTDNALTDAEIVTYKGTSGQQNTATFTLVGTVDDVCNNATATTTAWVAGDVCEATSKVFRITLADDECGASRLTELQTAYPDLTIAIDTINRSQVVTLTGTSGTANVTIGGVDYLATFVTDLSTTRANFVTANKAAIEAQTGGTFTGSGATLTLVAPSVEFPGITVTNVTTNLSGTVAASTGSGANAAALCQTTYRTTVTSNIVCDECSEEFRALFSAEAPNSYGVVPWESEDPSYSAASKMGIRFRGKEFTMIGDENLRDTMPFYATSTRIKVAGGEPQYISESWESSPAPYAVKILSIASEAEALGGYLWEREDQARVYFDGLPRFEGNNYGKFLWGQESRLKGGAQYVDYALTVFPKKYYQYTPHSSEKIVYHVIVETGFHTGVENLLNALAGAAGLPAVRAFAK